MKKILQILLKDLERRCKEQMDIELKVRDTVKEYLVENSFDSKYGAPPVKNARSRAKLRIRSQKPS